MTMVRFPRLVAPLEVALVAAARSIARSHPAKWKRAVMAGLFSLGIPTMIGAQPVSTGPEFLVNTYTTNNQGFSSVSSDGAGNFVVVWQSAGGQDGDRDGVFGQRFDNTGAQLGSEFQVNTFINYNQNNAAVSVDPAGNFVVVWETYYSGFFRSFVAGQRFDATGARLGGEFRVTGVSQGASRTAVSHAPSSGNFVVVFDRYMYPRGYEIVGQRYDSNGTSLGAFAVNTYTTSTQIRPAVATDGAGNFVVVWQSYTQDGNRFGVFGQRFDATGAPLGGEFQVNTYTTGFQVYPRVAADAAGDFIVVWADTNPRVSGGAGVFAQRYDATGALVGGEFPVNTLPAVDGVHPAVTADPAGDFVVVWQGNDGSGYGILGRYFDSTGTAIGGQFQVNSSTPGHQYRGSVTADPNGDFVVAWEGGGPGDGFGVFGQRFLPPPPTTTSTSTSSSTSTSTSSSSSTSTSSSTSSTSSTSSSTTTSTSTSTSSTTTTTLFACAPAPESGCQPSLSLRGLLVLKDATPDDRDKLIWKWTSSTGVLRTDFGDPLGTTDYLLCLYDVSGLKLSAMAPADGICTGQPCWTDNGLGVIKYTDKDLTPDGLQKMLLRSGFAGSAKILAKGLGANLGLPAPPLAAPVQMQLRRSGASFCWEATYSAPTRNEPGMFKARSD